jgi:hypothetical protein
MNSSGTLNICQDFTSEQFEASIDVQNAYVAQNDVFVARPRKPVLESHSSSATLIYDNNISGETSNAIYSIPEEPYSQIANIAESSNISWEEHPTQEVLSN